MKRKIIIFILLIIIEFPMDFFSAYRNKSFIQKKITKITFTRRSQWIGRAETYGAPTINLIVNFINDCHYRMRFYYYMGVSQPNVIFGKFKYKNNIIVLKDGAGNSVRMHIDGTEMRGADNNYRIYLQRIR